MLVGLASILARIGGVRVITDAVVSFLCALIKPIIDMLPTGSPVTIPGLGTLTTWIARADSFVPIAGPLTLMLGILSAVVVFFTVRMILTVVNLVKP